MRMLALGAAVLSAALTFAACSQQEIVDEATGNYDDTGTTAGDLLASGEIQYFAEEAPTRSQQQAATDFNSMSPEEQQAYFDSL